MSSKNLEAKIKSCLEKKCNINLEECKDICKNNNFSFGVAVSGGADSCCLLVSLCNLLKEYEIPVKVISINHYIRSDEETCGDLEFVKNLCSKLYSQNFNVQFYAKELKRGAVKVLAESRNMGIEEAARFLRYEAFEEFIHEQKILYLCLAHNKNDFYETLLMRFLQGASCDSFLGISYVREKYIRPLLDVERKEIEDYLNEKGQTWRTDSTNLDNNYLRNKIRNKLMPFLSENFEGWKTAIEKGSEKAALDSDFIDSYIEKFQFNIEENGCISLPFDTFAGEKRSIKIRLLLKMFNFVSENTRIPFVFLSEICDYCERKSITPDKLEEMKSSKILCKKNFADVMFYIKDSKVYAKKEESFITDYCFSDIIREPGIYKYDWGIAEVISDKNNSNYYIFNLEYKSGKTDKLTAKLPYQLILNHQ